MRMKWFVSGFIGLCSLINVAGQGIQINKNLLLNPGAENYDWEFPEFWDSHYKENGGANWVSRYGKTSGEWDFDCDETCGLPPQAGNVYFRMELYDEVEKSRSIDLYQDVVISSWKDSLTKRPYVALFESFVAASPPNAKCSEFKMKLVCYDIQGVVLAKDSLTINASDFRDLDALIDAEHPYGGNMHAFQFRALQVELPASTNKIRVLWEYLALDCPGGSEEQIRANYYMDNQSLRILRK